MTVRELINELERFLDSMQVLSGGEIAHEVNKVVECDISAYFGKDEKAVVIKQGARIGRI